MPSVGETINTWELLSRNDPVAIAVLSFPDLRLLLVNDALRKIAPVQDSVIGRSIKEVFPEIESAFAPLLHKVLETGEPYSVQSLPYSLGSGPSFYERFFDITIRQVIIDDQGTSLIIVSGVESTEHVRTARQLSSVRRSEQVQQALTEATFAATPIGLVLYGPSGEVQRMNPAAGCILGYTAEELRLPVSQRLSLGRACDAEGRVIPKERRSVVRALSGETFLDETVWWLRPDGSQLVTSVGGAPIMINDRLAGAVVTLQDLTETEELRRSERQAWEDAETRASEWNALFQNLPDAAVVFDQTGNLLEANQAWYRLMDLQSRASPAPLRFPDFLPEDRFKYPDGGTVPLHDRPVARILRGESLENAAYCIVTSRGLVHTLVSGGPIHVPRLEIPRYLLISREVTELRRLEELKDQFLQIAAHELRNPLQVLKGVVCVMKTRLQPEVLKAVGKYIATVESHISHMARLVSDLANASRVHHNGFTLKNTRVLLPDLLRESIQPYIISSEGRKIRCDFREIEGLFALVDPLRVSEIVGNLMSNAIKYTAEGGLVWVRASRTESEMTLRVMDDGIGIPKDDLERVFDGFFRARGLTEWGMGGLGLGLYISRALARKHGGDLWAENRPRGGTTMVLRLPLLVSRLEESCRSIS